MSDAIDGEEYLVNLVREAGNPNVVPDARYVETLRADILSRLDKSEQNTVEKEIVWTSGTGSDSFLQRAKRMRQIISLAAAVIILAACGLLLNWGIGGSPANIAFADIAKTLEGLKSATYDFAWASKNPGDGKTIAINSKGYFLAPSLERAEMSMSIGDGKDATQSIMILDSLAAKGVTLMPEQRKAMVINIAGVEKSVGDTANMFEMVRRLVREEGSDSGRKVEPLGTKQIDGRSTVGFRTRNNMATVSLWADPQTARLVRVDFDNVGDGGHGVMSNFRYDEQLEPSLFSLEPPAGYMVETQTIAKPVEAEFVGVLRFIAEHNQGTFPESIGVGEKTFALALQAEVKSESEKLIKSPEVQQLMEKLKTQFGEDKEGFKKAWMKEWMELVTPFTQKLMQKHISGMNFYAMLPPETDSHYVGKGVKLGTADRAIFWYKPVGSAKYRVIYADLSIKELTPEVVKKLAALLAK